MSLPYWIEGLHYRGGEPVSLKIDNGVIAEIGVPERTEKELPWIAPGFVDLQINGFSGMDFNRQPIADDLVGKATRSMWKEGVTSYLPTVTTNTPERIGQALASIAAACERDADAGRGVAGIHVEGPFISPEDGPRGAHGLEYVRAPDWEMFQRWQEAAGGRIKIITLSPEWDSAESFIANCAKSGVIASIGHTKATPAQIRRAVDAGAVMSTHLGNAAHPELPRHPNYIWDQLAEDRLYASLIPDGFHLPEAFLKVAMRVKGDKAVLVSDAVALSGMPAGEYKHQSGRTVIKTPEGKLVLGSNPKLLAGSAQMLLWGMEHLVRSGLCELAEAWDMASTRPARLIGLPVGQGIAVGAPADLVAYRTTGDRIQVVNTYKAGANVYRGEPAAADSE